MATQLFLTSQNTGLPGIVFGEQFTNLAGGTSPWAIYPVKTARGSSTEIATCLAATGPTNGIEVASTFSGLPIQWISLPLAAAATISGTITFNLWAHEANMSDNAAVNCQIDRLDSKGAIISTIVKTARVTEVGTSSAVNNFTATPTSTSMAKGDRLRFRVFFDDAGTMAQPGSDALSFTFSGSTAAANGDSYVTLTENLTFATTEPSGSTLYLTNTAGPAVGSDDEKEMWTSRGGSVTNTVTNTAAGWLSPIRKTVSAGGAAIEWYSKQLTAFTLAELVRVNLWGTESNLAANVSMRAELAVCNADGSSAVIWGAANLVSMASIGGNGTTGAGAEGEVPVDGSPAATKCWLSGPDTSVTDGQRLRLRVYIDDISIAPQASGHTSKLYFNVGTAGATGDSWIQLHQTVTEYSPGTPQSDSESGTGTDAASFTAAASDSESGVGTDDAAATNTLATEAETGSSTDDASVAVPQSDGETGTGTDASSITVAASDAETGAGTDAATLEVQASDSDTGAGTDDASVDTGAVQKSDSETGSGSGVTYTDDFNRADTTTPNSTGVGLGSNWTAEGFRINTNRAVRESNSFAAWWNTAVPGNHRSKISVPSDSNYLGVMVRGSTNDSVTSGYGSCYIGMFAAVENKLWIMKYTGNVFQGFLADVSRTDDGAPHTLEFRAVGSSLELYVDGVLGASATDSDHTGPYIGIQGDGNDDFVDSWEGGEIGGGDNATVQIFAIDSDSAAGTDDASVTNTLGADSDTGSGTDNATVVNTLATEAETGAGTDTATVSVAQSDGETGTGTDAASLVVEASDSDSGTGTDNATFTVEATGTETGAGTDDASVDTGGFPVSDSETGTGTDNASITDITATDAETGSGTDNASVEAAQAASESGAGTDAASFTVEATDSESGTGTDATSITITAADSETGTGTDTASITVEATDSDSGLGTDIGSTDVGPVDIETALGTDDATVEALIIDVENATGTDDATVDTGGVTVKRAKVWNGSTHVTASTKVWTGSAWEAIGKVWDGSQWVELG